MFTSLIYKGQNNRTIDLFNDEFVDLVNADGLTHIDTSIAASVSPIMDGDIINNVQANPRGIVLDLKIKNYQDVERAKRHVLEVFKSKQTGTLIYTQGTFAEQRIIEIEGVVEAIDMPRFNNKVQMQISIHCPAGYWQDVNAIILQIGRIVGNHHFSIAFPMNAPVALGVIDMNMTKTYTNDGDAAAGMEITIIATGSVTNPVLYRSDGVYIGVNDTMTANDKIVISTYKGKKTITKNGVSIFSKMKRGSTFMQLETGDNEFTIDVDEGENNVYFSISFKRRFV